MANKVSKNRPRNIFRIMLKGIPLFRLRDEPNCSLRFDFRRVTQIIQAKAEAKIEAEAEAKASPS